MNLKEFIENSGSLAEAARKLDLPYQTLWRWMASGDQHQEPSRLAKMLLKKFHIAE